MKSIAFATCRAVAELTPSDQLAAAELHALGIEVQAVAWDDPEIDWARFGAVVVRSCWDYTARLVEFLAWADRVAAATALWNPCSVIRWNARKTYLRDLSARGVEIVPTAWLAPGCVVSFAEVVERHGWHDVVLKPIVSASAADTWRGQRDQPVEGQAMLNRLLRGSGALVQRFIPEIQSSGEWSLVVLSSGYSHAVCKRPREGDFRVQLEHGGTIRRRHAPDSLVAQARQAAAALEPGWLFARVDGIEVDGRLLVMEVECIEPELFLAGEPAFAARFAVAIADATRA